MPSLSVLLNTQIRHQHTVNYENQRKFLSHFMTKAHVECNFINILTPICQHSCCNLNDKNSRHKIQGEGLDSSALGRAQNIHYFYNRQCPGLCTGNKFLVQGNFLKSIDKKTGRLEGIQPIIYITADRNVLDKSCQLVKHFLDFTLWQ